MADLRKTDVVCICNFCIFKQLFCFVNLPKMMFFENRTITFCILILTDIGQFVSVMMCPSVFFYARPFIVHYMGVGPHWVGYGLGWSCVHKSTWQLVGLGWVSYLVSWVGFGSMKRTHVQLWNKDRKAPKPYSGATTMGHEAKPHGTSPKTTKSTADAEGRSGPTVRQRSLWEDEENGASSQTKPSFKYEDQLWNRSPDWFSPASPSLDLQTRLPS